MKTHIETPDFNTLKDLYQADPVAYETLRRRLLNEAVMAAPINHRIALQRTLCRIEAAHQAAATPLEAAVAAFHMMGESWRRLPEVLNDLHQEIAALQTIIVLERAKGPSPVRNRISE